MVQNSHRSFGITPRGIDEAIRLAKIMAASGLMPKSIETPEAVFVAMQMGAEIGLSPMASVQNIAVINGTPWYLRQMRPWRLSGLPDCLKNSRNGRKVSGKNPTGRTIVG